MLKAENRSSKSSDASSSGHASDVELLSSSKSKSKLSSNSNSSLNKKQRQQQQINIFYSKQQISVNNLPQQQQQKNNYYDINQLPQSMQYTSETKTVAMSATSQQRAIDKIPHELRLSKQSFSQAMDNPCEYFIDVM